MPRWDETIDVKDVFHNEELSFPERRDAIVAKLQASRWVKNASADYDIPTVIQELATAGGVDEFDEWWHELYDYADRDRVWIATF